MLLAERVAGNRLGNVSNVKPFITISCAHIDVHTCYDDIDN